MNFRVVLFDEEDIIDEKVDELMNIWYLLCYLMNWWIDELCLLCYLMNWWIDELCLLCYLMNWWIDELCLLCYLWVDELLKKDDDVFLVRTPRWGEQKIYFGFDGIVLLIRAVARQEKMWFKIMFYTVFINQQSI